MVNAFSNTDMCGSYISQPRIQTIIHVFVILIDKLYFQTLIDRHTFDLLPPNYQYKLLQLLPECDRCIGQDSGMRYV